MTKKFKYFFHIFKYFWEHIIIFYPSSLICIIVVVKGVTQLVKFPSLAGEIRTKFKKTARVIESLLVVLKFDNENHMNLKNLTEDMSQLKYHWKELRYLTMHT